MDAKGNLCELNKVRSKSSTLVIKTEGAVFPNTDIFIFSVRKQVPGPATNPPWFAGKIEKF